MIGLAVHLRICIVSSKLFSIAAKRSLLECEIGEKFQFFVININTHLHNVVYWIVESRLARYVCPEAENREKVFH